MKKLVVLLAGVLVVLAVSAPAQAQTRSVNSPRDDSFPASGDIRRLVVNNGISTFRATIKLRRAVANRSSAFVLIYDRPTGRMFSVGTEASGTSHHRVFVRIGKQDDPVKVACKRLRVTIDSRRDEVRVAFPQTCLGKARGKLSVGALTEGADKGSDLDFVEPVVVRRG